MFRIDMKGARIPVVSDFLCVSGRDLTNWGPGVFGFVVAYEGDYRVFFF